MTDTLGHVCDEQREEKSESTQFIIPTNLCSAEAIGQSTPSDSGLLSLHDLRVLFWLKLGALLSALVYQPISLYPSLELSHNINSRRSLISARGT